MNKTNQKYIPLCYVLAVVLFFGLIYFLCQPKFEEYSSSSSTAKSSEREKEELQKQLKKIEADNALADMKMKNLKTIVETNVDPSAANMGMFGNLFETIITQARNDGLLIREISYELNPENDPIYKENAGYNVCELKLSLVGEYTRLKQFLIDLNSLEHLIYISKIDVTAFSGNTDYLIINLSINLYSKKVQVKRMPPSGNQPFDRQGGGTRKM